MMETVTLMIKLELELKEGMTKKEAIATFNRDVAPFISNEPPVAVMQIMTDEVAHAAESIEIWEE